MPDPFSLAALGLAILALGLALRPDLRDWRHRRWLDSPEHRALSDANFKEQFRELAERHANRLDRLGVTAHRPDPEAEASR